MAGVQVPEPPSAAVILVDVVVEVCLSGLLTVPVPAAVIVLIYCRLVLVAVAVLIILAVIDVGL